MAPIRRSTSPIFSPAAVSHDDLGGLPGLEHAVATPLEWRT